MPMSDIHLKLQEWAKKCKKVCLDLEVSSTDSFHLRWINLLIEAWRSDFGCSQQCGCSEGPAREEKRHLLCQAGRFHPRIW